MVGRSNLKIEVTLNSKIIIENRSQLNDIEALYKVVEIIQLGKISGSGENKQYCYYTEHISNSISVGVSAFKNEKSDRFVLVDVSNSNKKVLK